MDLELLVWVLTAVVVAQGGLSLWFVRWILWRNQSLTDLITWQKLNGEKLNILASRFRISTPPAPTPEPEVEPEPAFEPDIAHLEIANINLTLHE